MRSTPTIPIAVLFAFLGRAVIYTGVYGVAATVPH
jgi:hypothetical protein